MEDNAIGLKEYFSLSLSRTDDHDRGRISSSPSSAIEHFLCCLSGTNERRGENRPARFLHSNEQLTRWPLVYFPVELTQCPIVFNSNKQFFPPDDLSDDDRPSPVHLALSDQQRRSKSE